MSRIDNLVSPNKVDWTVTVFMASNTERIEKLEQDVRAIKKGAPTFRRITRPQKAIGGKQTGLPWLD